MYGVLYAISPELFPAKDRGTGNALTATATRIFGVLVRVPLSLLSLPVLIPISSQAPIIALYANLETAVPVYISGALIIFAGCLALVLPYEPRGKTSI